jgi:hypothetical protein
MPWCSHYKLAVILMLKPPASKIWRMRGSSETDCLAGVSVYPKNPLRLEDPDMALVNHKIIYGVAPTGGRDLPILSGQ